MSAWRSAADNWRYAGSLRETAGQQLRESWPNEIAINEAMAAENRARADEIEAMLEAAKVSP